MVEAKQQYTAKELFEVLGKTLDAIQPIAKNVSAEHDLNAAMTSLISYFIDDVSKWRWGTDLHQAKRSAINTILAGELVDAIIERHISGSDDRKYNKQKQAENNLVLEVLVEQLGLTAPYRQALFLRSKEQKPTRGV